MSSTNGKPLADLAVVRDGWVAAVNALVGQVEGWCKELDWPTRRASKRVKDKTLGEYEVPMLLMQQWDAKLLLNPDGPFIVGADGRVNLYTMPEYDDLAILLRQGTDWQMKVQMGRDQREPVPFTRETFKDVIETFAQRHAQAG
jgi:hypothetical protein